MNQAALHKYFKGIASQREEELILEWLESSEENRQAYLKERMLYDVALFSGEKEEPSARKEKRRFIPLIKWTAGIAASLLLLLSSAILINEYLYSYDAHQQTVTVPAGQRAHIVLADGTKVWLNAKSTLKYSASFGQHDRTVELDGEAYFEVTKNTKIPFLVNTENNQIKVVGTTFNVNAYKGTNEFEAMLVEGIVDIYPANQNQLITRLSPNELFIAQGTTYRKKTVGSYEHLRWREGLYCFDDAPFGVILKNLEKYYNINFVVDNPEILNYQITGKFREKDGVEHVLRTIQKDHKFTYTISEDRETVRID